MEKLFPTFRHRELVRNRLDDAIKNNFVGRLMGLSKESVDKIIERTFDKSKMAQKQLTYKQITEETVKENRFYDFDKNLKNSFLPSIVEMARDAAIRLVFVHIKRRRDVSPNQEPLNLRQYIRDLEKYLDANNAVLVDFTNNSQITLEHFGTGDHLSAEKGKPLFTTLLAKSLEPLLATSQQFNSPKL